MVTAVIDVTKDTSLIVDLTSVGVLSNGLLHHTEDGGGFLLDNVQRSTTAVWIRAPSTTFKREHSTTLPEGGNVVKSPTLDGELSHRTKKGNVVGGELDIDHPLSEMVRLCNVRREQGTYEKNRNSDQQSSKL